MTYSKLQVQNIVQLGGNVETKCAAANNDNLEFLQTAGRESVDEMTSRDTSYSK